MPRSSLLIFTKLKIGAQKLKSDIAQRACMSVSRAIVSSALVFHLFLFDQDTKSIDRRHPRHNPILFFCFSVYTTRRLGASDWISGWRNGSTKDTIMMIGSCDGCHLWDGDPQCILVCLGYSRSTEQPDVCRKWRHNLLWQKCWDLKRKFHL